MKQDTIRTDLPHDKLTCTICGADITREMKIYPHGAAGGPYCYDCTQAEQLELLTQLKNERTRVIRLYARGLKISEIAERTGMEKDKVYEILTKRNRK